MSFHVGLLYSTHDFLDLVVSDTIRANEFSRLNEKFTLAPAHEVYRVSQDCNWIRVSDDGTIEVSERGKSIHAVHDAGERLRLQLADLIAFHNPPWAKKLMYGRREAIPALPTNAEQCFRESGLLDKWTDELIRCWDELGKNARIRRSDNLHEVGRQAELWSVQFEKHRTGKEPAWQSLDSSFAGYDVLSEKSKRSSKALRIEVKGSERKPNQATFHVSKHEWKTAYRLGDYQFHLWFVSEFPKLYVVDYTYVDDHISVNQGDGKWSSVEVPFSPFLNFEKRIQLPKYTRNYQTAQN